MLVDAHCHPYDLPEKITSISSFNILAASSACSMTEFLFCEDLARNVPKERGGFLPCFGIHPQIFKVRNEECGVINEEREKIENLVEKIDFLASERRIFAIGECGFDLFNNEFKETEKQQDDVFLPQIEIAVKYNLPVVLHVRRAMHKIFALSKILTKCKVVIFHSWSGTLDEAQAILRKGINAYFSFGNVIMLNHKQAVKSCALLPADRLLTETDAPYQPRRGEKFSIWNDLPLILNTAAKLRTEAGKNISTNCLESQIEENFNKIFF